VWHDHAMGNVDVVIPTFEARELLLRCVGRLHDQSIAQIVVVDDASSDGTTRALSERFPEVRVVELGQHRGLAHALNRGSEIGTAQFVLFLNNDVFPVGDAITRLSAALSDNPAAACAGGRLVDPHSAVDQEAYWPRALPGMAALMARLLGIERAWPKNPLTGQHLRRPLSASQSSLTDRQPAGACLLVRRGALERVGGWDEDYSFWYEDVDLAKRLADIGRAVYVPDAVFEHIGRASTRHWTRYEQHGRLYHGTLLYAQRHLPRARQVGVGALMVAVCGARLLLPRVAANADARNTYRHLCGEGWALCRGHGLIRPSGRSSPADGRSAFGSPQ
jgi:GT2 family glycosyltransferase